MQKRKNTDKQSEKIDMGTWGTKITENDGTADALVDWGSKYFKKYADSEGYVDFKKAKITKADFKKALPKMLKYSKISLKDLKKPYLLGSPFISKMECGSKCDGYWHVNLVLAIYILGRNIGHAFDKDFLALVNVSGYQYAATSGVFTSNKHRESVASVGLALAKSTSKKGKINLMRYF
jgi:hypothetical protein